MTIHYFAPEVLLALLALAFSSLWQAGPFYQFLWMMCFGSLVGCLWASLAFGLWGDLEVSKLRCATVAGAAALLVQLTATLFGPEIFDLGDAVYRFTHRPPGELAGAAREIRVMAVAALVACAGALAADHAIRERA